MGPRHLLTIDQQYLVIVRLQTGCSRMEGTTELRGSQSHQQVATEIQNDAPAHPGCNSREQLLETGVPQMENPALCPDPRPIETPWDQLSCHLEAGNSVPQNHNDLRVTL
ncbi:hypothetical protein CHARACLAT_017916 [Characodon lateralis]|uniref:Uncharacterized protein n=1 Tax=Characodon lateralis TaxID=208331 RepID=A0ABU7CP59_9TELE|nr:hypothetical protein [Characodon lateralis]